MPDLPEVKEPTAALARLRTELENSLLRVVLGHFRRPVDAGRFLQFVSVVEQAIGSQFGWLSSQDGRVAVQDRHAAVDEALTRARNGRYFSLDNGKENDAEFAAIKFFSADTATDVTVVLSPKFSARIPELLGPGGDILECRWAEWTPAPEGLILRYQLFQAWKGNDARSPGFLPSHPAVTGFHRLRLPQCRSKGNCSRRRN